MRDDDNRIVGTNPSGVWVVRVTDPGYNGIDSGYDSNGTASRVTATTS